MVAGGSGAGGVVVNTFIKVFLFYLYKLNYWGQNFFIIIILLWSDEGCYMLPGLFKTVGYIHSSFPRLGEDLWKRQVCSHLCLVKQYVCMLNIENSPRAAINLNWSEISIWICPEIEKCYFHNSYLRYIESFEGCIRMALSSTLITSIEH